MLEATAKRQDVSAASGSLVADSDRAPSLWARFLNWKTLVIGVCVIFTMYIALVPLGFLFWQSFFTPQTAT
jgi:iron(III) transport system permease protein